MKSLFPNGDLIDELIGRVIQEAQILHNEKVAFQKIVSSMTHGLKKIKVSGSNDMPMSSKYHSAPSFYVDAAQMPEIKNWEAGKKYLMMVEVEQKSKNIREDSVDASFEIIAYKHIAKKSIDEMNDEEFGEYQGESLAKGELL